MPPSTTTATQSISTTFILLFVLFLAFFPGLFHYIWYTPLYILSLAPSILRSTPLPPPQPAPPPNMSWFQKTLTLPSKSRGSYLITDEITSALPELSSYKVGLLHLFIQHTSCALSLNENWDSDVRADMSDALDRIAPEDKKGDLYRHSAEGLDDMPAHIKSALVGASVSVPIRDGKLALGTWQGVWYLEFRRAKHTRKVVATIQGEKM
jgi:secondary thiamine-phosphate synthase enzyme